jgi:hypothetical protein
VTQYSFKLKQREIIMSTKKAYEQKQQAQLNEWAAQIKKLKAKADVAQAEVVTIIGIR